MARLYNKPEAIDPGALLIAFGAAGYIGWHLAMLVRTSGGGRGGSPR